MNQAVRAKATAAVTVVMSLALAGAGSEEEAGRSLENEEVVFSPQEVTRLLQHSPLPPPPDDPTNRVFTDARAARLGQFLFFDKRLSGNGAVSCATCHQPERGFSDGKTLAEGMERGDRHTLSLWNVAHHRWFFWDGRADTLWSQALGPLERATEMGGSRLACAHLIAGDDELHTAYEAIFGRLPDLSGPARFPREGRPLAGSVSDARNEAWQSMNDADRAAINLVFVNAAKALAAYERQLISSSSPFDEFVEGLRTGDDEKRRAISSAAQRGAKLFVGRADCRSCHSGSSFTDGEFHNTGVPPLPGGVVRDPGRHAGIEQLRREPFNLATAFSDDGGDALAEKGAGLVKSAENLGQFKTPTLRNVAQTKPYMHQGQLAELRDVLHFYSTLKGAVLPGHHREAVLKPLMLSEQEIDDLEAFLESLTGAALEPVFLSPPLSPFVGDETTPVIGSP